MRECILARKGERESRRHCSRHAADFLLLLLLLPPRQPERSAVVVCAVLFFRRRQDGGGSRINSTPLCQARPLNLLRPCHHGASAASGSSSSSTSGSVPPPFLHAAPLSRCFFHRCGQCGVACGECAPNAVARAHADPLRERAVLLHLLGERLLDSQRLVCRLGGQGRRAAVREATKRQQTAERQQDARGGRVSTTSSGAAQRPRGEQRRGGRGPWLL